MSTANKFRSLRSVLLQSAAAGLLALSASQAMALGVTLCAEPYVQALPVVGNVPMWGYRQVANVAACDSGAGVGTASPGPAITLLPGDPTLSVTLVNKLTVPTSIVIPGQNLASDGGAPVLAVDLVGDACTITASSTPADRLACRVRSFTGETAPGASRTYTFNNLRPGTYLYQSGTHPQVQVQMGLFGMVKRDAAIAGNVSRLLFASPAAAYDVDAAVVLSEVDPDMHVVISNTLGSADPTSWKAGNNSTLNYTPRFFLINGKVFDANNPTLSDIAVSGTAGAKVVLRIANAGLTSRSLMLNQGTWKLLTEDGNPYPAAREQATALLAAGKTTDAQLIANPLIAVGVTDRSLAVFDRRGGTDNADGGALGGQVARLAITNAGAAPNTAPVVNAGPDQVVSSLSAALTGSVTDDGQITPVTVAWTQVSGPGAASFGTPQSVTTSVTLPVAGTYTFRLTANDGEFTVFDDVVLSFNTAPVVNAGADQTLTVANTILTGVVTDDGVPGPVSTSWSLVSGPGTATFGTPNAPSTTVSFSAIGTYVLRLTASDGQLSTADDVQVVVNAAKHIGDLDRNVILLGTLPWSTTVTIRVENALHGPVANATVTGTWSGGGGGGTSCTTNAAGTCTVLRLAIPFAQTSNTFTVTNVTGAAASGPYTPADNHDPDTGAQASNGTSITVTR